MQKAIKLYQWIVKLESSEKLFSVLFLVIIAMGCIIVRNAENYRTDVNYYRNRLDNHDTDCKKTVEDCHRENKKAYDDLLESYKELYRESLKLKDK